MYIVHYKYYSSRICDLRAYIYQSDSSWKAQFPINHLLIKVIRAPDYLAPYTH